MSLDHTEMAIKMNSGVAFTSLDIITSTTKEFPDAPTSANGMTKNDHSHITSELIVFYFLLSLLSNYFQHLSRHSGTWQVYSDTGVLKTLEMQNNHTMELACDKSSEKVFSECKRKIWF